MKSFSPNFLVAEALRDELPISFPVAEQRLFAARPDSLDFENAFMTSEFMRLSKQISPACTR